MSLAADCGDYVVVTNANALALTGKKDEQKVYRSHTGWKLKEISYKQMLDRHPEQVRLPLHPISASTYSSLVCAKIIKKAVSGMLPKNKLRDRRLERLKVYLENDHPFKSNILTVYDAQSAFRQPQSPPPTSAAAAQSKPAS